MTRRTTGPADLWAQGITFWSQLWQAQIDQSLKYWALWASNLPRPTAAELSAEAEALRDLGLGKGRPPRAAGSGPAKPRATKSATLH
jgi:hypothetical protein